MHYLLYSFPTRRSSDLTSLEAIEKTVALAKKYEKPIVLNPAPYQEIDENLLSGITYITPNETEASLLTDIKDRKSTRLNSSHMAISYAVFCLKKKTKVSVEIKEKEYTIVGTESKEHVE